MYITYLDESGTPEKTGSTSHFILVGLAIPAETWKAKDQQVDAIKLKYELYEKEIHTAWIARDYPEQKRVNGFAALDWSARRKAVEAVRTLNLTKPRKNSQQKALLKNYKKTAPYIHLTRDERLALLDELASLVEGWPDARLFADAHDKNRLAGIDHFEFAFEQVVTRFNTYLLLTGSEIGLLVQDNNETIAKRLTATMRDFHRKGTAWGNVGRVIETPMFVDSELTSMVQLADLCAYAIRRFIENGERRLFDRVKQRIDRKDGNWVGIRHYTGRYKCRCEICLAHGRH